MQKKIVVTLMTAALAATMLAGCGRELKVATSADASTENLVDPDASTEVTTEDASAEDESAPEVTTEADTEAEDTGYVPVPDDQLVINADPLQITADSNVSEDDSIIIRITGVDGTTITADRIETAVFDEEEVNALTGAVDETIKAKDGTSYNILPSTECAGLFGVDMSVYLNAHAVNPDVIAEREGEYSYFLKQNGEVILFNIPVGSVAVWDIVAEDETYTFASDAEITVLNAELHTTNVSVENFAGISWEDGYLTDAEGMLAIVNAENGTITKLAQVYEQ